MDVPPRVHRVLSEGDLCREAGLPDLETLRSRYYSARDLRGMYPTLRDDHLRYLEKWGLVRPVAGRYSFADLHVVKQAAGELERGASLNAVLRALSSEQEGQLAFDFQPARAERAPARVVSLPAPPPGRDDAVPDDRIAADRRRQPRAGGEVLPRGRRARRRRRAGPGRGGRAPTARRRCSIRSSCRPSSTSRTSTTSATSWSRPKRSTRRRSALDAECFEAYFNLGNIHHDLARYPEAVRAYRDALAINPAYPEAHFYLAVTLEKLGRSAEAKPHWKEYRALAPDGEFVDLAKEFSD